MIPPDAAQANIDERKRRYREMADALIPERKRNMDIKLGTPFIGACDNVEMLDPESTETITLRLVDFGYGEAQEWLRTIPEYMRGKLVIVGHISPQIKDVLVGAFADVLLLSTERMEVYAEFAEKNSIDALYITTDGRNDPQEMVDMWAPKLKENGFFHWNIEA